MKTETCAVSKKCGGCSYAGVPYQEQLAAKQKRMEELLSEFGRVEKIIGMQDPYHYRNKVHRVFGIDRQKKVVYGSYEADSHRIVEIEDCLIEDEACQKILKTIRGLLRSFKIKTYDEDSDYGLLRHVLLRRGFTSGEIMVVLVLRSQVLPGKNNFVKALREKHPEITTIVLNVNDRHTSMVLGKYEKPIYGPGYIRDTLMGLTFRISAQSFYQVNPVQTEVLYRTAIDFAALTGKERVIDAYCGIGTIGLSAAHAAGEVIGIELNPDAVRDAVTNAKLNGITNAHFAVGDAGDYLDAMAQAGEHADVIFMDPPRSGSTEKFIRSAVHMAPERIVYVSCGPDTLARDLKLFAQLKYQVRKIQPVDMFPMTEHVETVVLMSKINK